MKAGNFMFYFIVLTLIFSVVYFSFLFYFDYSLESPKYELVEKLSENVEIRKYDQYYQAYVSYENSEYENQAFRKLFNFISGKNSVLSDGNPMKLDMTAPVKLDMTAPVKLDMTAPVKLDMTAPVKDYGFDGMAFVLPSDFDPAIIPDDSMIKIQKIEPQKIASIFYSGTMSKQRMMEKYSELISVLDSNGISYEKGAIYATYNGPYTLPYLRKNEVWVKIR